MPRRRAKARPARRTSERTPRLAESLGTRRGRRSSAPRGKHRRCNLQPATETGPRRSRWPAGSSTRPAARYKTSTGHWRASAPFVSSAILSILPGVISLIAYADCPVARECLISPGGVPLCRRRQHPRASRSQHKSSNYLGFCEASLLRTETSQNKYYRVHVQNKLTLNTRFQFSATKDSWAGGARGFNPGAISSLPRL